MLSLSNLISTEPMQIFLKYLSNISKHIHSVLILFGLTRSHKLQLPSQTSLFSLFAGLCGTAGCYVWCHVL